VFQASSFLAANGLLPRATRNADEDFLRGIEQGQKHLNGLAGGGLSVDGIARPWGPTEILSQRAISSGKMKVPAAGPAPLLNPTIPAGTPPPPKPLPSLLAAPEGRPSAAAPQVAASSVTGTRQPAASHGPNSASTPIPPTVPAGPSSQILPKLTGDPARNVNFSVAFRTKLNEKEALRANYKAVNKASSALGRYQLTTAALKEAGLKNKNTGHWTGKHGVHSDADFLNNPRAQELAAADYHEKNILYLTRNGTWGMKGQTFKGIKAPITITETGLVAAAHRQGAREVRDYLNHIFAHKGVSDPQTFPRGKSDAYLAIETRLREFQNVPLRP
tara:strand:- start:14303 stop:15298 length:996 start_codon:yes stop_codon:yes gene_type:complete